MSNPKTPAASPPTLPRGGLRGGATRAPWLPAPATPGGTRQEYRLTAMGKDLFPVMVALRQFGERHLFAPQEPRSRLIDRADGQPVRLDITAQDGRAVGPDDTVIVKVPEAE